MPAVNSGKVLHHAAVLALLAVAAGVSSLATMLAWQGDYGLHSIERWRYWLLFVGEVASACVGWMALVERAFAWRRAAWPATNFAPFRLAAYVLVIGALLFQLAFQPFHPFYWLLNMGLQMGVLSLALWILHRRPRRFPRALARGLDRALLVLTLTVVTTELALRAAGRLTGAALLDTGTVAAEAYLRSHRFAPGRPYLGMRVDSRGYHDRELELAPNERLVVSVGDSFSIGMVPHYFHYTTVAERGLQDTEVYNMGVVACGPPEYNLMIEGEALELEPSFLLLAIFIGNDLNETKRARPSHRLARSFYDREFLLSWELPGRLSRLRQERAGGFLEGAAWSGEVLLESKPEILIAHYPWLADAMAEPASMTREAFLDVEAMRANLICDPSRPDLYPRFFSVLAETRQLLGSIPMGVLLIPDEFQVEDELWQELQGRSAVKAPLERDLPQARISAWLEAQGIPYLDPLPDLRRVSPLADGKRHVYLLQDTHFNRRGNEVVGELLATFLAEQLD